MIDFRELNERIFLIFKNQLRKEVFQDDHISYPSLEEYVGYLMLEPLLIHWTGNPIIKKLFDSYNNNEEIDNLLISIPTYYSMYDELIDKGIIELKQHSPVYETFGGVKLPVIQPREYIVRDAKKFEKLKRKLRKELCTHIFRIRIGRYIEDVLDEINRRGVFAASKISDIANEIKVAQEVFANRFLGDSQTKTSDENLVLVDVFSIIDEDIRKRAYDSLEVYFDNSEKEKLRALLHSETIDSKIIFKGSCKALCYPFRQLHFNGKLSNKKTTTIALICDNFNYTHNDIVKECDVANVKNYISKADISFPKAKRILISTLVHRESPTIT